MLACGLVRSLSTSRSDGYYGLISSSNGYINFDDVAQGEDREFLVVGASYSQGEDREFLVVGASYY